MGETMLGCKSSNIILEATREGVLIANQNVFVCQVCKSSMTGLVPAESHLQGSKHKKAVQMSRLEATAEPRYGISGSSNSEVQAAIKSGQVLSHVLGNQVVLTCVPCNKPCSGEVPLLQHLSSEVHAKRMRKEVLTSTLSSPKESPTTPRTSTPSFDSALPNDVDPNQDVQTALSNGQVVSSMLGNQVMLTCVACNKTCSGEVPMKQHLLSDIHAKKMRQPISWLGVRNTSLSPPREVSSTPRVSPTRDTSASPISACSTQDGALAHGIKEGTIKATENGTNHLQCMVCDVFCTGAESMAEHLQGKNHLRQLKIFKQTSKLVRSPVSSPVHSKALQDSPSSAVDGMAWKDTNITPVVSGLKELPLTPEVVKRNDGYECTVCRIACNSHSQMTSHLQGEPHRKQCRLRQGAVSLHQPPTAPERETQAHSLWRTSTPKDIDLTNDVIPPPPQFTDSPLPCSPATQKVTSEESRGSSIELEFKRLMELLPDVRTYMCDDSLTDLFEE